MIINYIIWSSLISLLTIVFLYPLRFYSRGEPIGRVYASLFLLPAVVSAILLLHFIYVNHVIIDRAHNILMLPFYIGIHLNDINALLIFNINLAAFLLIIFLPKNKFAENMSLAAMSLLMIFLVTSLNDQFIKMAVFSIGSIILSYMLLNDEAEKNTIQQITQGFVSNIASDFLAFVSLLLIVIDQKILLIERLNILDDEIKILPRVLFFTAVSLRLITLITENRFFYGRPQAIIRHLIFYRIFVAICPQILLLHFAPAIFGQDQADFWFIIAASIILLYSILIWLFDSERFNFNAHSLGILSSLMLLCTSIGYYFITTAIICLILTIYPLATLNAVVKNVGLINVSPSLQIKKPNYLILFSQLIFQHIPIKIIDGISKIFLQLLNPVYSGFFLYRLPQILMGILQIPLRFLNNGNIQRSLLFVVLIVVCYIYWWGQP